MLPYMVWNEGLFLAVNLNILGVSMVWLRPIRMAGIREVGEISDPIQCIECLPACVLCK